MIEYYYEVAPTQVIRQNSNVFTYSCHHAIVRGSFVIIPVGKKTCVGVVVKEVAKPQFETRPIGEIIGITPLPDQLVDTTLWISNYYSTHLATVLQTALPGGLTKKRRPQKDIPTRATRDRTSFLLNKSQVSAVEKINAMESGTALLHGVTGSGKTAVYLELARRAVSSGNSVIVLVPEIALTAQLASEFIHDFPEVVVAHSRQTEAERHTLWQKVLDSPVPLICIGPRSTLFLPISRLGLIIIDEAHEPSYKQEQAPRYSALRVARILASHHGARVVQGSATPLVSEYYFASRANRPIIHLPSRAQVGAKEPTIHMIDMTKRANFSINRVFSDTFLKLASQNLSLGHQVLVYHNRRGSASLTLCTRCGWSAVCPQCFVPYVLHVDTHTLSCHICNSSSPVPTQCPTCSSTDIIHKGIGTKLIESELTRLFPNKKIARFDADTSVNATLEKRYEEVYDGSIDIIIGTQTIAKGLDLPKLRLVGVVQADAGLGLPDYTSEERTFQLLNQVIGRVGRTAHDTDVVIQTFQPNHPAIHYGIAQNYREFYDYAIHARKRAQFPPFVHLLKLTCTYKTERSAVRNAKQYADELRKHPDIKILGPTPAFYERVRDTYRWQIIVKAKQRKILESIARSAGAKPHWQSDLDPANLI